MPPYPSHPRAIWSTLLRTHARRSTEHLLHELMAPCYASASRDRVRAAEAAIDQIIAQTNCHEWRDFCMAVRQRIDRLHAEYSCNRHSDPDGFAALALARASRLIAELSRQPVEALIATLPTPVAPPVSLWGRLRDWFEADRAS